MQDEQGGYENVCMVCTFLFGWLMLGRLFL